MKTRLWELPSHVILSFMKNAKLFQTTNLLKTLFLIIEGKFPIHFNEKSQQHFGNLPGSVFSFHTYQNNFLRASKRLNELAYKIKRLYLLLH